MSNSIIEVKPDENGNIDALFGFNGLVYDVDKYDSLVIKTNILTWGESGVSFSLNGKDFYEIKSDRIVLSKEILNKFGIKTLNNIVFKVTSVNEFDNVTKIKIRGIYLEKQLDYVTKYSAHYFVKEGNSLRRIDTDKFDIDLNSLFYISREEFLSYKADSNKYYNTLETMIKDQLGSFIDSGVTLQETINNIQEQYDSLSKDYNEFIKWTDIADATAETSGLMSASDKRKLDSIESMSLESLDEILTL